MKKKLNYNHYVKWLHKRYSDNLSNIEVIDNIMDMIYNKLDELDVKLNCSSYEFEKKIVEFLYFYSKK